MKKQFIDLGLSVKWSTHNEGAEDLLNAGTYYHRDDAFKMCGVSMPTSSEITELIELCKWEKLGVGYKVTGPNGNSIILPISGYTYLNAKYSENDVMLWSRTTTPGNWCLHLLNNEIDTDQGYHRMPVRLVSE